MKNKGFTLIELLVVIAIIGILSSVVLASLNRARAKAANAAVKSDLAALRDEAALFYDTAVPHSYDGLCTNAKVSEILAHVETVGGADFCYASGDTFVAGGSLKVAEATTTWWCVDGEGNARGSDNELSGTPTVCP